MAAETKKERFERISLSRRDKVLDAVRLLENCSNKSNYEYTQEEIDEIFSDIEDAVAEAKARFKGNIKHNGIKNFKKSFESEYTWLAGFMRNVDRFGDKEALHSPRLDKRWTYKELNAECNKFANAMKKDGVKKTHETADSFSFIAEKASEIGKGLDIRRGKLSDKLPSERGRDCHND